MGNKENKQRVVATIESLYNELPNIRLDTGVDLTQEKL
jgi:hypothetical protein